MATPFTGSSHRFSFQKGRTGKEAEYIGFESQVEKGREPQTLGREQRIFCLFLNLSPSWTDMGQKEMIKTCRVQWILSSISELTDEMWFGSIDS